MNSSRTAHASRFPRRIEHFAGTRRPRARRGFTLIEMLVALVITLIMMGSVVTLFGVISDSVAGSRSLLEMTDRLRAARNRLQLDLQGATATMKPPLRPENDEGYLEIIEGPLQDKSFATDPNLSIFGDPDDVLMLTVRSRGEPFVGKIANIPVESQTAEVMYFAVPNGPIVNATTTPVTRLYTLYRRVLLVNPGFRTHANFVNTVNNAFYDTNDISVHVLTTVNTPPPHSYSLVPNSLGDLTKRENRFARLSADPNEFPFQLNDTGTANRPSDHSAYLVPLVDTRLGDDVLMTNVIAFDVQVWDPNAPLQTVSGLTVGPSDPGFTAQNAGYGAYVDLGYNYAPPGGQPVPWFNESALRNIKNQAAMSYLDPALPTYRAEQRSITNPGGGTIRPNQNPTGSSLTRKFTYDTWSLHYENDGIDQNGDGITDGLTNGLDDDGNGKVDDLGELNSTNNVDDDLNGVVDDKGEWETRPPFEAPLRGIRITIRAYEPSSQQVREVVVVQDFLPE